MWWLFGRRNGSGFSSSSTAEEVTEGIDGTALTAIVTGSSLLLLLCYFFPFHKAMFLYIKSLVFLKSNNGK